MLAKGLAGSLWEVDLWFQPTFPHRLWHSHNKLSMILCICEFDLLEYLIIFKLTGLLVNLLIWVSQKQINAKPRLKFNWGIHFSCIKVLFTTNVLYSLQPVRADSDLKVKGKQYKQTNWKVKSNCNPALAYWYWTKLPRIHQR